MAMKKEKMRVAVIGCGAISDIYLTNMTTKFPGLEVTACCSRNGISAERQAKKYGIRALTTEQALSDPEIEIVVNLTPPAAHYALVRQALEAGKHVYTEKALANSYTEAQELVELAKARGLGLCCAPDTLLGAGLQTGLKAVRDGRIGQVTSCNIVVNRDMGLLYGPLPFTLGPGAGVCRDVGPYYFSAALAILGPARRAFGFWTTSRPQRIDAQGKPFVIQNENLVSAVLQLASGVQLTVQVNGDTIFPEKPVFTIYGTKGFLQLGDANQFDSPVWLQRGMETLGQPESAPEQLPFVNPFHENSRGLGVAEMAAALCAGRRPAMDAALAAHAVECFDAIERSSAEGRAVELHSDFPQFPLLDPATV
jgi:predicted dehydrogenase